MGSKRPSGGGGSPRRLEGEKGPARDVPKTPGDAQRRITRAGAPVGWRRDTQPAAVLFWHQRAWYVLEGEVPQEEKRPPGANCGYRV